MKYIFLLLFVSVAASASTYVCDSNDAFDPIHPLGKMTVVTQPFSVSNKKDGVDTAEEIFGPTTACGRNVASGDINCTSTDNSGVNFLKIVSACSYASSDWYENGAVLVSNLASNPYGQVSCHTVLGDRATLISLKNCATQ